MQNNIIGTETLDIPFHITLGCFSLKDCAELENRINAICTQFNAIKVKMKKISHFDNEVLFVKPAKNKLLLDLQKIFCKNNIDKFNFYPHTTLLCSYKAQVKAAKKL